MREVRAAAPQLAGLKPYDPKYLPASAYLSANENPCDIAGPLRERIDEAVAAVALNRYPDPLANGLRDAIAEANGLVRGNVLLGNGGDELLFDLLLAWGGPGRKLLDMPPTFSVYAADARLTGTEVVEIPRRADHSIDEEAVLARVAEGDIDLIIVTSPNNPTGMCAPFAFVESLLDATDALVVVDEAYCEFSGETVLSLLPRHGNLAILRTFSKAYSLAGVRLGYVLAAPSVIEELCKVRQPYSVDAVSQAIGSAVYENRELFADGIEAIIAERERVAARLTALDGIEPFPSQANWVLFAVLGPDDRPCAEAASQAWEHLYGEGVLVRDFSHAPRLEGTLRASIGTPEENERFLGALEDFLERRAGAEG